MILEKLAILTVETKCGEHTEAGTLLRLQDCLHIICLSMIATSVVQILCSEPIPPSCKPS